jgi:hypothetical protein
MLKDGQAAEARQKVLAWWRGLQQHGEKEQLVRGVANGDRDSPTQAARLLAAYPEAALDAIDIGARRGHASVRAALIHLAGQLDGDAAATWLRDRLHAPLLSSRVAAARALWARGDADVLADMLREWHQLPSRPEELTGPRNTDTPGLAAWNEVCSGPYDLINFLVLCRRPEAVRALAAELPRLPVEHRTHVIGLFAETPLVSFSWGEYLWGLPAETPEVAAAVDELLAAVLADTDTHPMSGIWGGKSVREPRLGDLAAHVLSRRWRQPASFDLEAPPAERDRQRAALREDYLRRR